MDMQTCKTLFSEASNLLEIRNDVEPSGCKCIYLRVRGVDGKEKEYRFTPRVAEGSTDDEEHAYWVAALKLLLRQRKERRYSSVRGAK